MTVKLLTEHHLELLSLKGGCICSYESTLVKIPHCWKSHVTAHILENFPGPTYKELKGPNPPFHLHCAGLTITYMSCTHPHSKL